MVTFSSIIEFFSKHTETCLLFVQYQVQEPTLATRKPLDIAFYSNYDLRLKLALNLIIIPSCGP